LYNTTFEPLYLSGFGVDLALKSLEYKVIDEKTGTNPFPDSSRL
jgi:hypothetical protein